MRVSPQQIFREAVRNHQIGHLAEAERLYRLVLESEPHHADSLHLLGVVVGQSGRHDLAQDFIAQAIAVDATIAAFHYNRGNALKALGRSDEAVSCYTRSLHLKHDAAEVHFNLGNTLKSLGQLESAAARFVWALAARPDFAEAYYNYANLLKDLGNHQGAAKSYGQALRLRPDFVLAHYAMATLQQERLHRVQALVSYRRTVVLAPEMADAQSGMGVALHALAGFAEGETCYRRGLVIDPFAAETHLNLGNALLDQGRIGGAVGAYRSAVTLQPHFAEAYNNLGTALQAQGRVAEARRCHETALRLNPDYADAASCLLICLSNDANIERAELFARHVAWGERFGGTVPRTECPRTMASEPALRVGFVSSDFHRATLGSFLEFVWAAIDPAALTLVGYSGTQHPNALTDKLRKSCALWRDTSGLSDASLESQIRVDRIDVLIDLAGHTMPNRLRVFARKPAPVQASWLCYWDTTGLAAMDAILMDPVTVPYGGEAWFVEKVIRLPDSRFCYTPPAHAPEVTLPPVARTGAITFGSFNNLAKVTPSVLAAWGRILAQVPQSRLVLKRSNFNCEAERLRVKTAFAAAGGDANRLELRGWSDHAVMLGEYGDIDIALDTFPFCGGLTSCEALWMGVPVVTLPGLSPVSRQTLGFLSVLGLEDGLVAGSLDAYVAIAAQLAADPSRLVTLRTLLRPRMAASPLCDAQRFARNLESALRQLWEVVP